MRSECRALPYGGYLPDRIVNLAIQYLTTSLGEANTYKVMKPQLDGVMFSMVFPLMCFTAEDAELWTAWPRTPGVPSLIHRTSQSTTRPESLGHCYHIHVPLYGRSHQMSTWC